MTDANEIKQIIVMIVFFKLTVVRANIRIIRPKESPCINPPIVAPRNNMSPALLIQPNLNVEPMTGMATFETRCDFRKSFTGGQSAPETKMRSKIKR